MAIHKYTVQESQNLGLGQAGSLMESGNSSVSATIVAITFLQDSIFTTLTPHSELTDKTIGTTSNNGDSATTVTFPKGLTIFGKWSGFQLSSGSVVAYLG